MISSYDCSRLAPGKPSVQSAVPDVKAVRLKLGLSQTKFAQQFGFSVRMVQQWEQGREVPYRTAQILWRVIKAAPQFMKSSRLR
jgi:DNA-binding transcriptional regulator YiaG